jgi:hypothetical protein
MPSKKVWFARDADLMIDNVISSVSGSSTLESQISATGTWTSRVKNVGVELGERDIEPINVMGLQQLKQENRPQIVTMTFNTVFYPQGATTNTTLFAFLFGVGSAVGVTGYNRYQAGEKANNDRTEMAVLVKMTRPGGAVTDTATILLNNATVTAGPVRWDAEGHLEQEWTVKCLAADLYIDTGVTADPAT